MKGILSILKPAPHIDMIPDPEKVKSEYKYWRLRIFYSMFIGYALFYFTRKSFTFAMPGMIQDLGFDKSEVGILGTLLYLSYGLSKFASGILSDRSNPRYFMSIGLIITGFCNIFFGLSSSLLFFALFWTLNGWFQGWGWPPCARLLTHWYSKNERGSWWSSSSLSHNVGGALIPLLVAVCVYYFGGWRYAMYIPGIICIFGGLYLVNRLRDTPQSLGLPPIEEFRNDYSGCNYKKGEAEQELTTKEILFQNVLNNPYIWMLAIAYFFVYVVRTAANDWSILFLIEKKGYSQVLANSCIFLFEVGGFCGVLLSGWASDRLFSARRGPINVIFASAMVLAVAGFWLIPEGYVWLDSIAIFMLGLLVFGPQVLIGLAAVELAHKKAAATANGFVGWFAYFGAAWAGYPLGAIAQNWGWDGYFLVVLGCCVVSTLLLLPLWSVQGNEKKVQLKPVKAD